MDHFLFACVKINNFLKSTEIVYVIIEVGDSMTRFTDNQKGSSHFFGDYKKARILDYEQMNEHLDQLKICQEHQEIGTTTFGYPIRYFTYGHGPNHVILTAGTHAVELITNCFLIHFMEYLEKYPETIDQDTYTLHFIPILNPEGTIVLTSAIRTVIPRTTSPFWEELFCIQYYMNAKVEDSYVLENQNQEDKLQMWMFRYATPDCIDDKHKNLKKSIARIIEKQKLPRGVMAQWSSNGVGIDLNANVWNPRYEKEVLMGKPVYHELRLNQISMTSPGPVGCPFRLPEFQLEPENKALFHFYETLIEKENVLGSFIYHACGNLIYYIDPPNDSYNRIVAQTYQKYTGYQVLSKQRPTTVDYVLKKRLKGTLLIELGNIRATPLSQFVDSIDSVYSHIMEDNTKAIIETIKTMKIQIHNYQKN